MHPTIDNGAVINSPMHDSGGGVQQHVNSMLTSIAIAEQIDIVSITFQGITEKYLKVSIVQVFVKIILVLFKIIERILYKIASAIGMISTVLVKVIFALFKIIERILYKIASAIGIQDATKNCIYLVFVVITSGLIKVIFALFKIIERILYKTASPLATV